MNLIMRDKDFRLF